MVRNKAFLLLFCSYNFNNIQETLLYFLKSKINSLYRFLVLVLACEIYFHVLLKNRGYYNFRMSLNCYKCKVELFNNSAKLIIYFSSYANIRSSKKRTIEKIKENAFNIKYVDFSFFMQKKKKKIIGDFFLMLPT